MNFRTHALFFAALTGLAAAEDGEFVADAVGFRDIAQPFFARYCVDCHNGKKTKGELNLESGLGNDFLNLVEAGKWGEILNVVHSHEMPPEEEAQPSADEAGRFADWVAGELVRAEVSKKSTQVVIRRLNRNEYANTIRDLVGVEFDIEAFPEDPPSGGFDNIGSALTVSPLHLELYYDAARKIIEEAIVKGEQPPGIKWHFEPEESTAGADRTRVDRGKNKIILNSGRNEYVDGFTALRTTDWDRQAGFRDFKLEHAGEYIVRIRASSGVPKRDVVVEVMRKKLTERAQKDADKRGRELDVKRVEEELDHFRSDPMYDYGPGRLRVEVKLGGQPTFIEELDFDSTFPEAKEFEIRARFDTQNAGVGLEYAYIIPPVLENFWCQRHDDFPRPEVLIDWVELEGPVYPQWPPASHVRLFEGLPAGEKWGVNEARAVLVKFMPRAWRRPVTDAEIAQKLALFDAEGEFLEAIKAPLVSVLTSPHFLYIGEPSVEPRLLNSHELATRLSYFLWSSMPDASLADPLKEIDRMLADPRSAALSENFAGQWLDLRKIGANPPAADLFPRYDRHLEVSIAAESVGFFREILENDLSVLNFVRSDFVTINERLARFYGIAGVRGDEIRKVPAAKNRGGIVTQASVLSVTSNGTRTSPVVRGTWILKNLLGKDPGLPVANVGEISPKVPGIDKATVRQRLEIHRTLPQCARCHSKIDPLGFALENFNAAGEWRDKEGFGYKGRIGGDDPDIDASAKMPDGTEFIGVSGLQEQLLRNEDLFLRCLSEKMFTYALGRELGYSDKPHVDGAVAHLKANGYTLRSLIHYIANSKPFLTK
jgi:hypothetical protein